MLFVVVLFSALITFYQFCVLVTSFLSSTIKMKGLQTGIPIALLAAVAQAQIQDNGGNNAAIPVSNFYNDQSLEIENKGSPGSHHSPPIHARPGQSGPGGAARHPPMAHASAPRAVRPDDNSGSAIPTCSTETVVQTVTQTVPASSSPSFTPYGVAGGYGGDDGHDESDDWAPGYDGYGEDGDSYDPGYGYDPVYGYGYPPASSAAHVPAQGSSVVNGPAQQSSVVNAPYEQPSAAHVAQKPQKPQKPASSPLAPFYPGPTPRPSGAFNRPSAHVAMSDAVPTSTSVADAAMTSTAVHGAQSYDVIPVNVPHASKSSVRLHGSASATPSSSANPSGADPNRAHGTYAANPSSSSVAFTGGAAQLAPSVGMASALCGLVGLLAFAL